MKCLHKKDFGETRNHKNHQVKEDCQKVNIGLKNDVKAAMATVLLKQTEGLQRFGARFIQTH